MVVSITSERLLLETIMLVLSAQALLVHFFTIVCLEVIGINIQDRGT